MVNYRVKEKAMNRFLAAVSLVALLLPVSNAQAKQLENPETIIGTLKCKVVPHSGLNLLLHSTKGINCEFAPSDGSPSEFYKGESGIKFGIDVNLNSPKDMNYSVLAREAAPGTYQLAGKYSGAGGSASAGASAGNSAPIEKNDGSIALQPTGGMEAGFGVAAGFTYIYLEPDKRAKEQVKD